MLNPEYVRQPNSFLCECIMLTYRKAVSGDIPFLFQCYNERIVAERASLIFEDDYSEFHGSYLEILKDSSFHVYIVELRSSPVGFIQIRETNKEIGEAEGSIWLGRKRDRGYGLNAFYLLLSLSFETLKYKLLWGWVRENNKPMHRICQRFGIRITDTCKRPAWKIDKPNHLEKIFYYEVTAEEFGIKKELIGKYGSKTLVDLRLDSNPTSPHRVSLL